MTERLKRFAPSPHAELAGNLSTGLLKLIALASMFIDHTGKVLFNNASDMRLLGRIAFPLYAWCMIVGFCRTRSVPKYLGRILQAGLVSQPLYYLALNTQGHLGLLIQETVAPLSAGFSFPGLWEVLYTVFLKKPNIFLTLFLGLCALWGIRQKKYLSQIWAPAIAIALATVLNADYGWKGVTLFILLYAVRNIRPGIAAVMVSFFLFWGSGYELTRSLFGIPVNLTGTPAWLSGPLKAFLRLETYGLLALPLMLIRFPHDLRMPKWLSYSLYPAHLVIIILQKLVIFG